MAAAARECPLCTPGSGNAPGHRGRHLGSKSDAKPRSPRLPQPASSLGKRNTQPPDRFVSSESLEPKTKRPRAGSPAQPPAGGAVPQPRGRPPLGKSWDGAAGRWVTGAAQPAKPAAKSKKQPSVQTKAGAVPQPRGRPPLGKSWDGEAGGWVTSAGQPAKPAAKK